MFNVTNIAVLCVQLALLAVFGPGIRRAGLRGLIIVALMAALSAAGSAALVSFPGLQPSSFIVMMCGAALGPGAGALCGAATALLARLIGGGLGPWALWQGALWCLMGVIAGLTRRLPFQAHAGIGFVWGFVFGWVMNLWWYTLGNPFSWAAYLAVCAASFTSELAHALTNGALMLLFGRRLKRLYEKYGGAEA
ncbi:MAG: ECF transporter S component [Oscillospiraceae bacterium]|nr:ECF transporter S component [Oscillospiraceae bacterium]